ncbi:hypothetical protein HPB52_016149 [Rhipicephalus sanguineus]|uniref:Uncharacterized protein n=1 Tax=Rhipicephalus sanguineus TaxID=34632 RepID=A0A9D4SST3_RHISA|nr:hypothetical protein HPB52_016149 [Rhipicephalus sanguineus]
MSLGFAVGLGFLAVAANAVPLERRPDLGEFQDESKCFPYERPWFAMLRNFESDPYIGGTAKCVRVTQTAPLQDDVTVNVVEFGHTHKATRKGIDHSLFNVYSDCDKCKVYRNTYAGGYVYGAEMPQREAVAPVPSAQYAACPTHGAIVGNTRTAAPPQQQAPQFPAAKVPSTKTSATGGVEPRSNVVRSFSDPATGRVAALAEKLTASRVSPTGSFSSIMTANESSSTSSPSEEKLDEEEDDEDAGTERTEGAVSDAAPRFSGNRKAFSMLPKWWKDLNLKELSAQTVILAAVFALIVSFVAMMVIEVFPETRDHHHHHSESQQSTETTGEPPVAKSGGSMGPQGRAATYAATPASTSTSTLATTRKKDYDDDETEATGDPPATSSGSFDCDTEACRWQIRLVDEKLNVSVKPCVDFYSYVCSSGWEMNDDLPYRAAGKSFLIKEVTKYVYGTDFRHVLL